MDEPLQEVNIYEFDDDEDNYCYKGKGGLRSQFQNQTFPRVSRVSIRPIEILEEEPVEEPVEPVDEAVDEESTQEEYIDEEEPDIYERLYPVEETEWTIHSELLKTATNKIIEKILAHFRPLNQDGTIDNDRINDGTIDAEHLPELHEELDNAITFLVNIHVYNLYNDPEDENEMRLPQPPYNYADSDYQHNLDYIIELLKIKDNWLSLENGWVEQYLITNRMNNRLDYHYGLQHSEREGYVLDFFRAIIANESPPIEQPTDNFNIIQEAQKLKGFYNDGHFDKKDKIPRGTFLYGTLMDLLTYERDNFKKLHKYIQDYRNFLLNFNAENDHDDLENIRLYNIFDREMIRIIMIDRREKLERIRAQQSQVEQPQVEQSQVEQPQVSSSGGGRKKIKSKRKRKLNKSKKKQRGGKKFVSKKRKKARSKKNRK